MYHHVRKGETLHHIAKHYRTHVHHLISLNPHIHNPHGFILAKESEFIKVQ